MHFGMLHRRMQHPLWTPMHPTLFSLLFIPLSAGAVEGGRVTQIFNDPTQVTQALSEGDVSALRRIQASTTSPVVQQMAKTAERRVLLDIVGARKASEACLDLAQQKTHLAGLTVCGALRAGIEAASGDLPAWARLTVEAQERVRLAAGERGKTVENIDIFTRIPDYAALSKRPTPVVRTTAEGRIPLHTGSVMVATGSSHDGGRVDYLNMAQLQIDGKSVEVLVDTGSSLTIVHPSMLSTPPLMDGFTLSGVLGDTSERSALAQPQTIQFGSLIIDQPLMAVSDRVPANLLGLDVISRLGRVLVSKAGLQVLAPGSAAPACHSPMFSAMDLSGTRMVPRMFFTVNGKQQEAMLDTGYSGELMESLPIGTALPPGPLQHSVVQGVQGQQRETSVSREVTVQTLGAPARLQMSTYIGNHPNKTRYVLGGGILRSVSLYLDFIDHRACIVQMESA